ncbi:flagellar biosynthesis protein FlhB [Clostridium minihomine]|uniref:flagellar biosynthesis protein FlhB n=1 Tax=Clostridium minihomine TaxID=2045012 RepID=UPI000C78BF6F|nr:flagellar biosynthesis protein FlhB [Clostridium minihomine]
MADSSKTEKATPKKRQDERKKGNIFQSTDIISAFTLLVIFFILRLSLPHSYEYMQMFLVRYFSYGASMDTLTDAGIINIARECITAIFLLAGPMLLTSIAMAVIGTALQTKLKFSREKIKFKFSNISPLKGMKRIFSLRSIVELIKSVIKISIMIYLLYTSLMDISHEFTKLMYADVYQAVLFILKNIMNIVIKLSIAFIAISALDYLYQWWEYERNIRMSKQDIKEEYKQMEGDPHVKGQQKERRRKMSMQRMMQQVPTADVIVRNPTHFAIALRYDIEKDAAPIIVAKGQDYVALRIIEIAQKHQIPMTENKALARALYSEVEVNRPIPAEYYVVLAEVMAWVYSMKRGSADIEGS